MKKMVRKILSFISVLVICVCFHHSASAIAYNVPIETYDAFRAAVLGNQYEVDDSYGHNDENGNWIDESYQCVDGAALLWQQLGRSLNTGGNNARGTWENESARSANQGNDFLLITDITQIKRGDVVVLGPASDGTYSTPYVGHIGFADEDYNADRNHDGHYYQMMLSQNSYTGKPFSSVLTIYDGFFGAFRYKNWHDIEPPVISDWEDYSSGQDRIVFSITDNDAVDLKSTFVKVWEYGQTIDQAEPKEVFHYTNGTGVVVPDVYKSYLSLKNKETIYYLQIETKDMSGNAQSQYLGQYSFFPADSSSGTGTYRIIDDTTPFRIAPYAKINGKDTDRGICLKGDKVQVIGSYVNGQGNLWYKISDDLWVYSKNVKKEFDLIGTVSEILKFLNHPIIYCINNQIVTKTASVDAKEYYSANEFNNNITRYDDGDTIRLSGRRRVGGEGLFDETSGVPLHTIIFDGNGGLIAENTMEIYEGNTYGYFPTASRYGYVLTGWFTDPEAGSEVLVTDVCTEDLTLYAHWAEKVSDSGTCGENLTWSLREDGLLKIEGFGAMTSAPWQEKGYTESILEVLLPEGLTSIYNYAFSETNLIEIHFPSSLTSIGDGAFYECGGLTELEIPDTVTNLGQYSFALCGGLKTVKMPAPLMMPNGPFGYRSQSGYSGISETSNVETLILTAGTTGIMPDASGDSSNSNCYINGLPTISKEHLTSITIGEGVKHIGNYVFSGCNQVTHVSFPSTLESIGESAFSGLTGWAEELVLPEGLTSLGSSSFSGCGSLTALTLPQSLTAIPWGCFNGCSSIAGEISFHPTVTSISDSAFYGCSGITAIEIPDTAINLYPSCFGNCSGLRTVKMPADRMATRIFGESGQSGTTNVETLILTAGTTGIMYDYSNNSGYSDYYTYGLPYLSRAHLTSITIGEGVKHIGNYMFYQCGKATHVSIPSTLESIGKYAFSGLSSWAEELVLPEGLTSLDMYSFAGCSSLTAITLPRTLTSIPLYSFSECSGITEIEIPDTVISLGQNSFMGCTGLKKVKIPAEQMMPGGVFGSGDRFNVETLILTAGTTGVMPDASGSSNYSSYYANGLPYMSREHLTSITIEEGITHIGDYAFYGCSKVTHVSIPSTLESIGQYAFSGMSSWADPLVLPEGLTSLGNYSFSGCGSLTALTLPQSLTAIPWGCFNGCSSIAGEISFHPTVTSISDSAFYGCSGITAIEIPDTAINLYPSCFGNCSGLRTVKMPADRMATRIFGESGQSGTTNVETLILTAGTTGIMYDYSNNSGYSDYYTYGLPYLSRAHLTSITIGEGVKHIGNYMFYQCGKATHVSIPSTLESIGKYAFSGLSSWAEELVLPEGLTSLDMYSFAGCKSLTALNLPGTLNAVPLYCFSNCSSIQTIRIPSSLGGIQSNAFSGCNAVNTILFDDTEEAWEDFLATSVSQSGNDAILGINGMNPTVITAEGIPYIEPTFILPAGLTVIEEEAFSGISAQYVKIVSADSIGRYAFSGVLQITLPGTIANIDDNAFAGCPDLVIFTERGSDTWAWARSHRITVRSVGQ